MNTSEQSFLKIDSSDGPRLGLPIGLNPRRFSGIDTVEMKKVPGLLISADGSIENWEIEKFIEKSGQMVAVGPWIDSLQPWKPEKAKPAELLQLLSGFRTSGEQKADWNGLHLWCLGQSPDGGLFLPPAKLSMWYRENCLEDERFFNWERWSHPDLKGEESWAFSLGMTAWMMLTGNDPAMDEQGELRRERLRLNHLPPIRAFRSDLKDHIVKIVDQSLRPGAERRPSPGEWSRALGLWQREGAATAATGSDSRQQAARSLWEREERRLRSRRWIRKSGWKYLIAGIVTATLAFVLSVPVRKFLEAPATAGMSRLEVARTYYQGINSLDSELMDDALARNAGKNDLRQVNMVFVTHKVRQGYEGLGDLPLASQWLAEGRPELAEGVWPWELPI